MKVELSKQDLERIISWASVRDVEWELDDGEKELVAHISKTLIDYCKREIKKQCQDTISRRK